MLITSDYKTTVILPFIYKLLVTRLFWNRCNWSPLH